jgi:hypothetical protein
MPDAIDGPVKSGTHSVHFIYETDPWDSVAVSLPPNGLGLRFDT